MYGSERGNRGLGDWYGDGGTRSGRGRSGRGEHGGRHEHGGPPPWVRGQRMRRGDIRVVLLASLIDEPAHGYEIIRRLEERSGGVWRPSAGSVYPTLQLLEEEGMLTSTDEAGKRVYHLTDTGRQEAGRATTLPWDRPDGSPATGPQALREAAGSVHSATRQMMVAGTPEQIERALDLLKETRQKLYQLLAEG
jgi:DNA-binding PadR family transcriptional regulator